jgi:hypothetical protein
MPHSPFATVNALVGTSAVLAGWHVEINHSLKGWRQVMLSFSEALDGTYPLVPRVNIDSACLSAGVCTVSGLYFAAAPLRRCPMTLVRTRRGFIRMRMDHDHCGAWVNLKTKSRKT